jgi:hypothetical protein
MAEVSLSVSGNPASQGSHAIMYGRIVQVNSSKHKAWRKAIVQEAINTLPSDWVPIDEPCELIVIDSLTDSGIVVDDSRIVRISARKIYAQGIESGASIVVKTLD